MASEYKWEENPIRDILLTMMFAGIDVSDIKYKLDLYYMFTAIIEYNIKNQEDLVYMDFNIKKFGILTKVIGNNIISALWLSGILPENPMTIEEANKCFVGNIKYTFDKKNKILKQTLKK